MTSASPVRSRAQGVRALGALFVIAASAACGKSGPPLPPLIRVPLAPVDIVAERRGDRVDVQFTVPVSNTDNTRPANARHMDVYAVTGAPTVTDEQMLKVGTKVGSVAVKSLKDPNAAVDPDDELAGPMETPQGAGLDQGALARVSETLTPAAATWVDVMQLGKKAKPKPVEPVVDDGWPHPLFGAPIVPVQRLYAVIGYNDKGKKGPFSKRVMVPLVTPPPAPSAATVTYTEKDITVKWTPTPSASRIQAPPAAGVLPARIIGSQVPVTGFNVYEVAPRPAAGTPGAAPPPPPGAAPTDTKLTKAPLAEPTYTDTRVTWGVERCYQVRAVDSVNGQTVESDAAPPTCVKLVDSFAPAAPRGLTAVGTEGAINLIWQANAEPDLAGYIVYRGTSEATLVALMNTPVLETTFRDGVAPGIKYVYAVAAVDKAGNTSPRSNRVEETGR